MPIALVQTKSGSNVSTNPVTLVFTSNLTAGNDVIVGYSSNVGSNLPYGTVTDNLGNGGTTNTGTVGYTRIFGTGLDTALNTNLWYAPNVSGGVATLSISNPTGATISAIAREYSGVVGQNPINVNTNFVGTSTGINSGTISNTTQPIVVITAAGYNSGTEAVTGDALYSNFLAADTTNNPGFAMQDLLLSSTGAQVGTFVANISARWIGALTTFQAASGKARRRRGIGN